MAALGCVPTVTVEKMQQWAEREQRKRQDTKHMRLVLAEQEKAGDREKTEQGESGTRAPPGFRSFVRPHALPPTGFDGLPADQKVSNPALRARTSTGSKPAARR
jgi:hypothetical protein